MNIMMILGGFPFMTNFAVFEKMQRSYEFNWAEQQRLPHPILKHLGFGGPAMQYIGPGTGTMSIDGALYPGQQGMPVSLALLRAMGNAGIPWPLLSYSGFMLGMWVIKKIDETRSDYVRSGPAPLVMPRKIDFNLSLQKYVAFDPISVVAEIAGTAASAALGA
jgi:phage tail protein